MLCPAVHYYRGRLRTCQLLEVTLAPFVSSLSPPGSKRRGHPRSIAMSQEGSYPEQGTSKQHSRDPPDASNVVTDYQPYLRYPFYPPAWGSSSTQPSFAPYDPSNYSNPYQHDKDLEQAEWHGEDFTSYEHKQAARQRKLEERRERQAHRGRSVNRRASQQTHARNATSSEVDKLRLLMDPFVSDAELLEQRHAWLSRKKLLDRSKRSKSRSLCANEGIVRTQKL